MDELFDSYFLSSSNSLLVFAVHTIAVLVAVVFLLRRLVQFAQEAMRWQASENADRKPDRPGPIVLRGVARWIANTRESPVRVTVEQEGALRRGRYGTFMEWKERNRSVQAAPFRIELPTGQSIRVEPEVGMVTVHDKFDSQHHDTGTTRLKETSLANGEPLWISGVLRYGMDPEQPSGNYRDGRALVLRAGIDTPMLLSTESLVHRSLRDLRYTVLQLAVFGAALAILHGLVLSEYHAVLRSGVATTGTLQNMMLRQSSGRRNNRLACIGTFRIPSPDDETSRVVEVRVARGVCSDPALIGNTTVLRATRNAHPVARPYRLGAMAMGEGVVALFTVFFAGAIAYVIERSRLLASGERLDETESAV